MLTYLLLLLLLISKIVSFSQSRLVISYAIFCLPAVGALGIGCCVTHLYVRKKSNKLRALSYELRAKYNCSQLAAISSKLFFCTRVRRNKSFIKIQKPGSYNLTFLYHKLVQNPPYLLCAKTYFACANSSLIAMVISLPTTAPPASVMLFHLRL